MTTVAWDGDNLAADSLGDQNGLRMPTTKLHRGMLADGNHFIIGCAGETSWSRMLHQWVKTLSLETVETEKYPHQVNDGPERNDPHCILVLREYGVFYKVGPMLVRLERRFHAVGSGRDYAVAAMHLGLSAKDAVKVACELDCYSGGTINIMSHSGACQPAKTHSHECPDTERSAT